MIEEQRVHRVQIDVSVIDPRGDDQASVPGLPLDAFELRLDGVPLPPELAARVEFDEICEAGGEAGRSGPRPTIIVLVDLNFLDLQMRHAVGKAIHDLADLAASRDLRVKVVAYGRRLAPLMPDFSGDADEIRRAAARLVEVPAAGPPRSLVAQGVTDEVPPASEDPAPDMSHQFGVVEAPDPDRPRPAITIDPEFASGESPTGGFVVPQLSPLNELARREVDPRPSLAALEAVMLSHAAMRGRKALVLFSSSWFDLPEELFLSYLEGPRLAAQAGFTIWSVDARGLTNFGSGTSYSRLLGDLATSSGGEAVRSAGRLAIAFERALRQLSCYYLFSVPVAPPSEGVEHHNVLVRLDTARYPEYWHYRVRSMTSFSLLDGVRQRQRLRLAALMEPQGYRFPDIRVTASYPRGGGSSGTPIEVSLLLSDLTFLRDPGGEGLSAEFSWEGLVSDERGRRVCTLGDGRRRVVRSASPPLRYPPAFLVLRTHCPLDRAGLYDIRVVVEDLVSGDVGAATALLEIARPGRSVAGVSSIRLGRNSGRDFLVELPAAETLEVARDAERRSFGPLRATESIGPSERLIVRFVSCNHDQPPRVVLYRDPEAAGAASRSMFQVLATALGAVEEGGGSCREFEGIVPENTLAPGRYGLAFIDGGIGVGSREELERRIAERRAGAFVEFEVGRPPEDPESAKPKREVRLRVPSIR